MLAHPWVKLELQIDNNLLELRLSNNKPDLSADAFTKKGIGLNNVKKRLCLLYPEAHSLTIIENDMSYDVFLKIALYSENSNVKKDQLSYTQHEYELA